MLTRLFLAAVSAMFFAFGAWSLTNPGGMTSQLGVEVGGPAGLFEMRGVYGGISLGAALLCLGGAIRQTLRQPALWFLVAYMGGYVLGRGASLIAGDSALLTSWIFAGFELAVFAAAAALLARSTK